MPTEIVSGQGVHFMNEVFESLLNEFTIVHYWRSPIGSTPYDLVFGLNAIQPMEFLVPTLPVAQEPHQNGHK